MLKKIVTGLLCSSVLLSCTNSLGKNEPQELQQEEENKLTNTLEQQLDFSDSNDVIYNPDIGFYYRAPIAVCTPSGISNVDKVVEYIGYKTNTFASTENSFDTSKMWNYIFDLVHLEFDLSALSATSNVDGKDYENLDLTGIDDIFNALRTNHKTAIIRFAYDNNYDNNLRSISGWDYKACEPLKFEVIKKHIKVICSKAAEYSDVITAVECGMIGPWGEMHTTQYGEARKDGLLVGYILEVIETFINEFDQLNCKMPLLVRQPRFMYSYILKDPEYDGSYVPEKISVNKDSALYRIGFFNDAYLDKVTDQGTYKVADPYKETDAEKADKIRNDEIAFMDPFTNHTPFGGEMLGVYGVDKGSAAEFEKVHLSYLNLFYDYVMVDKLNDFSSPVSGESMFKYVLKHMGYRYYLSGSTFSWDDEKTVLALDVNFTNNGFGSIPYHREKGFTVYFVQNDNVILEKTVQNMIFDGNEKTLKVSLENLPEGEYEVYLKISDVNKPGDFDYPIRLANSASMWNETLKATKIGSFNK